MTVKGKLRLGFTVLIVLLMVLAISTTILHAKFQENMNKIVNEDYEKIVLLNRVSNQFNTLAKAMRDVLLAENAEEVSRELENVYETEREIEGAMASLEKLIVKQQAQRIFNNMQEEYGKYISLVEEQAAVVGNKKLEQKDIDKVLQDSLKIQTTLFDYIEQLTSLYESDMKEKNNQVMLLYDFAQKATIILALIGLIIGVTVMSVITRNITSNLNQIVSAMFDFTEQENDFSTRIEMKSKDEFGNLAKSFNRMIQWLQEKTEKELEVSKENEQQAWLKTNVAEITTSLQGRRDLQLLSKALITKVTKLVKGSHGAFYITEGHDSEPYLKLYGTYAYKTRKNISDKFEIGEGIVGQSALEKETILLTHVPEDYIKITSGLGEASPLNIIALPVIFEEKVLGVIEVASFTEFDEIEQELLLEISRNIGSILQNIKTHARTEELLRESQALTEELQTQSEELITQQEELERMNTELEQQAKALKQSENVLQHQQEELEQSNADLEEKAKLLEEQNKKFEQKSREAQKAKVEVEEKAKQLELISKYKSEFLANMSHELRTPLNSLLILSKLLSDNKEQNLTDKQIEFIKTIYSSGCDLLNLINEILDLSKVESGNIDVFASHNNLSSLKEYVEGIFIPVAEEKGIGLHVELDKDLPRTIYTDQKRLEQILKNLLSNAFKFTKEGQVSFGIKRVEKKELESLPVFKKEDDVIAFTVKDTGIGIPKDKQDIIFEAFQQVDGTTNRKYGGTGLGLSISRELASLLGGIITVHSSEGEGSEFTLYVPAFYENPQKEDRQQVKQVTKDPYLSIQEAAPTVTAEPSFSDQNEEKKKTEESSNNLTGKTKRILIVEDDLIQLNSMGELMNDNDIHVTSVSSGEEALDKLKDASFDCMVLDLGLSNMSGFDLLEEIQKDIRLHYMPILIYTGKDLSSKEEVVLKKYANTIIVKDVHSPERLLEELSYFLQEESSSLEEEEEGLLEISTSLTDNDFENKKILLVDDDIRNVFALSNMLESHDMEVLFAENGREGIEVLKENPNIDLVLMDIMMPEMDGYEAITKIRSIPDFKELPIIALTAKAMKDDRKKCIDVGASDYIAKPINDEQLFSLIRVWLYQ